jgi:hypothetical protein
MDCDDEQTKHAGTVVTVEDCDSRIKLEGDESGSATSWTEVVSRKRKKKTDVLMTTNLGGEQSKKLEKLTLFTKSKLVKQ